MAVLKQVGEENARLKKLVAELSLDKAVGYSQRRGGLMILMIVLQS